METTIVYKMVKISSAILLFVNTSLGKFDK